MAVTDMLAKPRQANNNNKKARKKNREKSVVYAEELTLVSIFTGTSGFHIRFEIFSQNFSQIFYRFVQFYLFFRHNRSL